MGDMSQVYHDMKANSKANSLLESNNIKFDSKNDGVHLIVYGYDEVIDFYPSTGRWIVRGKQIKSRGVGKLIKRIENRNKGK